MPLQVWHGTTPAPRKQSLVLYKAVIRLQLEYSSIAVNSAFTVQDIQSRLEQARVDVQLTGNIEKDALILALAKMKLLLDLGPTVPDATPEEMRKATYERFPAIDPATTTTKESAAYARILCHAGVYEDANPYWEITVEPGRRLPPGLNGKTFSESEADSDLELFCKNLMRADLIERMQALHR